MVPPLSIDFQKAFDCVSHSILLHKLEHNFGITGNVLAWLRDYLSEREQYIVINGIPSENTKVAHGIPQGSVLGPNSSPCTQAIYRKQLTLQQRSWSDNSNALRMTKQEDILLCCITKQGNLEPLNMLFRAILFFLSDFDAFVQRLLSKSQANSQVCFRWMSKCVI